MIRADRIVKFRRQCKLKYNRENHAADREAGYKTSLVTRGTVGANLGSGSEAKTIHRQVF